VRKGHLKSTKIRLGFAWVCEIPKDFGYLRNDICDLPVEEAQRETPAPETLFCHLSGFR
jgi:hypothetical protein